MFPRVIILSNTIVQLTSSRTYTGGIGIYRLYSILGLIAFGILGYSVGHLGLTLFAPDGQVVDEPVAVMPATELDTANLPDVVDDQWPALFGVYDPQLPGVVAVVEPKRTLSTYRLKGLFSGQISKWAIIEDPTGEYLIREGDTLSEGEEVLQIDDTGVTLILDDVKSFVSFEDG